MDSRTPEEKTLLGFEPIGDFDISFGLRIKTDDRIAAKLQVLEKGEVPASFTKPTNLKLEYSTLYNITCFEEHLAQCYNNVRDNKLNRYSDIKPFAGNRVLLKKKNVIGTDYINASYVGSCFKDDHKAYIATQGPIKETIDDFWRMIIGEEAHLIIMLCKEVAGDRPQCSHYWPDYKESKVVDGTKITCTSETVNKKTSIVERKFDIENESKAFEVRQYQWQGWPDHGVPDEKDFPALDDLVDLVVDYKLKKPNPVVVHCSAGVGRTGTLLSLVNLTLQMMHLRKQEKLETTPISVFSTVRRLREYRFLMVQTLEQYDLVYKYALKLLGKTK